MKQLTELEPTAAFCAEKKLPWNQERAEKLTRYLDLLMQFNEAMNLIGPMKRDEAVQELLLDSIVAAAARQPRGPILDVGTGAGLPGIPLKILFPDSPITLVEPRQKRSNFLKIATHRLKLDQVQVQRCRIEDLPPEPFDFVISKAFEAPTKWLHTAHQFLASQGAIICMARQKDREELMTQAEDLGLHLLNTAQLVPDADPQARICYAFTPD